MLTAVLVALPLCLPVHAEDEPYWAPAQEITRPLKGTGPSEEIDPYTGGLKLAYTDVHVPGNGGLDINVNRIYDTGAMRFWDPAMEGSYRDHHSFKWVGLGLGWAINVAPKVIIYSSLGTRLLGENSDRLCGGSDVRPHYYLEHVDGRREPIVGIKIGEGRTATNWKYSCASKAGPFVLHAPDGTRYELGISDNVSVDGYHVHMYTPLIVRQATKVIDKNGNQLDISYQRLGNGLYALSTKQQLWAAYLPTSITANDGRSVTFSYDPGIIRSNIDGHPPRLLSISVAGRVVQRYIHGKSTPYDALLEAVRADGTKWKYAYWPLNASSAPARNRMKTVYQPQGGSRSYEYSTSGYFVCDNNGDHEYDAISQISRVASSDGGVWTHNYVRAKVGGQYDVTTVSGPKGTETYKHIGVGYFRPANVTASAMPCSPRRPDPWKLGLPVDKSVGGVLTETYVWTPRLLSTAWSQSVISHMGLSTFPLGSLNYYVPRLSSVTKLINGATHTETYSNPDPFGSPGTRIESGPNGGSRTTTMSYVNDTSKWIIGQLSGETFPGGSQTRTFDAKGNMLSVTLDGVTTSYTYDGQGNVAKKTLPRGLVHTYSNYKRGIPQSESQPEGITLSRVVDDFGNVVSEINGEGQSTAYTYDGLNRVTSITYPVGNKKTIAYTATTKTATRGGLVETTVYDGFGHLVSITLGGIKTTFSYDALGRKTFESDAGVATGTRYQYDILDRITRITNSDGTYQTHSYGAGTKKVTDERGKAFTYAYRSYGDSSQQFLMSITAADPATSIAITRNARDLVTAVTQAGLTRTYGYNSNHYLVSEKNPETGSTIYSRDAAGNMISRAVGGAGAAIYTYDGQNRLKSASYPGSTPTVAYTYNKSHKLLTANSAGGNRSYGYDANGNLTRESLTLDGRVFTTGYAYNANDQLSSITYPRSGRVVNYGPDVLGRPTRVSGYVSGVSYWPSGLIKQISYANGTVTNYGQNLRLWPSSFSTVKTGGGTYLNSAYAYDGAGNITSIRDAVDASYNRTLAYDDINRLTSASGPWGTGTIAYNGAGNITSQVFGTWNLSYTYASNNRLTSVSGSQSTAFGYDAYGNIVTGSGSAYTYDGVPNLRCVNCANATNKIEYVYDGANNRSSVLKGGVRSYEMYDAKGHQLIEFTPSQSNKLVEYIYLGGKRIAQVVTP